MEENNEKKIEFIIVNFYVTISLVVLIVLTAFLIYIKVALGFSLIFGLMVGLVLLVKDVIMTTFTVTINIVDGSIKEIMRSKKNYTYDNIKNIQIVPFDVLGTECYLLVFNNMLYFIDTVEGFKSGRRVDTIAKRTKSAFSRFQRAIDISEKRLKEDFYIDNKR